MVFGQESSQAVFEMGNVELIEFKTSMIQCPSFLHNVFKGTNLCRCGKHSRPHLDARRYKHGPNLWQENHHKAKDAPRGCSKNKRQSSSIWDRRQNDETYRESQLAINWSDAWVRYLDHIVKLDISHTAPHLQRNKYNNRLYLRSVDEDKQAPPPQQRPGYQDAKKALVDLHKQVRQDCRVIFITKIERQRLRNQLDPSMQWSLFLAGH